MICTYCGTDKAEDQFSAEHVLPRTVTSGGLTPTNPFVLRSVCRRCNSLCGRYVDRPFAKNWLTQNHRAKTARRFVDLSVGPEIPLTFMGHLATSPLPGRVCDNWLGPTGDLVFHFHDPYPDPTEAGMPLDVPGQASDPGFVFLIVRASNPAWHPCILNSVLGAFEGATFYLLNGANEPPAPWSRVPDELKTLAEKVRQLAQGDISVQSEWRIDYGDRFLAKLALGFGGLLLDPAFAMSADADRLRRFLWEPDFKKRAAQRLNGGGFLELQTNHPTKRFLGWQPGHTVFLMDLGDKLALVPTFYGEQAAVIQVAQDRKLWQGRVGSGGVLYVVAPGFKTWVATNLGRFLAAQQGLLPASEELAQFLARAEHPQELPPYDL